MLIIKGVVRREMLDCCCCCTDSEFGEARGTNEKPGRTTRALLYGRVVAVLKEAKRVRVSEEHKKQISKSFKYFHALCARELDRAVCRGASLFTGQVCSH